MSKQQFESNVKPIPYAQSCVYAKLADLNNLAVIKERFNDPSVRAMMSGQVPEDKLNQLNERCFWSFWAFSPYLNHLRKFSKLKRGRYPYTIGRLIPLIF